MQRKPYLIVAVALLVLASLVVGVSLKAEGIKEIFSSTRSTKEILKHVLYMGIRDGKTGEYIYITAKEDIDRVINTINNGYKVRNIKGSEGYSYYLDVFSCIRPDETARITVYGDDAVLLPLMKDFFMDSSRYKKDKLYFVDNEDIEKDYKISFRCTDVGIYPSSNPIIEVDKPETVKKILSYLKTVRFTYEPEMQPEGLKGGWVQIYYKNQQIEHFEFKGSSVIKHGEEYIVSNPEVMAQLYSYMEQLKGGK